MCSQLACIQDLKDAPELWLFTYADILREYLGLPIEAEVIQGCVIQPATRGPPWKANQANLDAAGEVNSVLHKMHAYICAAYRWCVLQVRNVMNSRSLYYLYLLY